MFRIEKREQRVETRCSSKKEIQIQFSTS